VGLYLAHQVQAITPEELQNIRDGLGRYGIRESEMPITLPARAELERLLKQRYGYMIVPADEDAEPEHGHRPLWWHMLLGATATGSVVLVACAVMWWR
jgi:hypothetical protein